MNICGFIKFSNVISRIRLLSIFIFSCFSISAQQKAAGINQNNLYITIKDEDSLGHFKTERIKVKSPNTFIQKIDSLNHLLAIARSDTAAIKLYEKLGSIYRDEKKLDSSVLCYKRALEINKKRNYSFERQCSEMGTIDYILYEMGDYSQSIEYATLELQLTEKIRNIYQEGAVHVVLGHDYREFGDYRKSLDNFFTAKDLFKLDDLRKNIPENNTYTIQCIAEVYLKMNVLDSALMYTQQVYNVAVKDSIGIYILFATRILGDIYFAKGDDEIALYYYRQYIPEYTIYRETNRDLGSVLNSMARIFQRRNRNDSSIFYAKSALIKANENQDQKNIYDAANLLYNFYSHKNGTEAFNYFKIATEAKDSMISSEKIKQAQILSFNEEVREKEKQEADAEKKARDTIVIIIASIIVLIISFLIWRRLRQLSLKHQMILEQKEVEKLKAIDKMKERFFSNITHELRTPLSLIMSPAEFYLEHPEELNDASKVLKGIYKNSVYLLNLINQLLDISKLDAGKMNISLAKGDIGIYIDDLLKTFKEAAEKKQIALHLDNDLNSAYLFDEEHWKKIFNNLLGNALKFTPSNGDVFVSVKKISGAAEPAIIQLVVKDTGIGIDAEQVPFITNRFYQADNKLSRKYEGAGIGLSLVNELVKLMGGKLDIESEKGSGSGFTVTAPLLSAKGKDGYPEIMPVINTSQISDITTDLIITPEDRGMNVPLILVTEDNKDLREFLKDSIEQFYNVITASNGMDGFEMALSQIPDMIISDVMMPVMDGFEFCDKIKSTHATSHIPFIILSAKTTYESRIKGLQRGADDYLTKPVSVGELRTKIKNILSRQEQLRQHYLEQLIHEDPLPAATEMHDEFLKKTFKIIEEHIDDSELSVEFLAAKMDMNNKALNRKFSFLVGLSANELIRQYKVKKAKMEHQMLELEAKALRAQMNPHFIFNCINSIKSLIQKKDEDKAINYLITFSKLIRTIFQNSDKREITLFDEIETCKLYMQLESMRFGKKFTYHFIIDEAIDLKSAKVPALIIQPFIENAIWHGIMPKEEGGRLTISIKKGEDSISCIIDDDGIGREISKQNKFKSEPSTHESKGVHLTQSRLDLDNVLNQRNASIEIIDKKDALGIPVGTKIVLTFFEF